MKIEVNDDFADEIVGAVILNTYKSLKKDLKKAKKNPDIYHEDDITDWEKLIPALDIVGAWYVYQWDKKK
jgi:transposase